MSLTQSVKSEAQRLGFELVGITTPDPPPHLDVFERWLQAGRHAEMGYLATERSRVRRADPLKILPECRSILVLGVRYHSPPVQDDHTGRVASYAWGDDYHDVLPERMQALVGFIERQVGHSIPNSFYTDTGPLLERELAQRAGLGWIGKNTCLIHPRKGSYFLLAEMLLGVELEPNDAFASDHCGSCTRCLDACPTNCILPDRTLDASRCISYLTIELKGQIPEKLRPQTGSWVFGCDICQQVCPWNQRFAEDKGDPAFSPRPGVLQPDLVQELLMSQEEFTRKFKGSPIKRAKRRGYLRNVAVAFGNSAIFEDRGRLVSALSQVLTDETEPLVRGHAAWALGQVGGHAAIRALKNAILSEAEEWVRSEIDAAIKQIQR